MSKNTASCKTSCPLLETAELLSDTWTILIMRALTEEPKRFSELQSWLENISSRTLTLKLKKLQELKLIIKSKNGFYTSTKKGAGLKTIEEAMIDYAKKYL